MSEFEVFLKVKDEMVEDGVRGREQETVIHISNKDAVFAVEKTWINEALFEATK